MYGAGYRTSLASIERTMTARNTTHAHHMLAVKMKTTAATMAAGRSAHTTFTTNTTSATPR
jgi:hypothetical protein